MSASEIARSVLYEGFSLYPYRTSSLKNQKRLLFGTLTAKGGDGPTEAITEVLAIAGAADTKVRVTVRFLTLGAEAKEESVTLEDLPLEAEIERSFVRDGVRGAVLATTSAPIVLVDSGSWDIASLCLTSSAKPAPTRRSLKVHRIRVVVRNEGSDPGDEHAMGAAHVVLRIEEGQFVSAIDPPAELRAEVERCKNVGLFPVLVGPKGATDEMLASPIILYDHPEVAAESAGDLFDATEIEEILSLRILTLTDDEKRELRQDPKTRALLERVEKLGPAELARLHGVLKKPSLVGKRVSLRPKGGADAYDVVLRGMSATVVSVEHTVDGDEMLCVTIDADPGHDLGREGIPGHRFFFRRDEVELT